jgi:mRNA interferase RelE/StbE
LSSARYRIFLERAAEKELNKLDPDMNDRIKIALEQLKQGFLPNLDIKKLKGYKQHYRLRVGDFRILFEMQPDYRIMIFAILPRKKAYKR